MQVFDFNIGPGKVRTIDVVGDYVYYLDGSAGGADSTLRLRNSTGADSILLRPGQAYRLGSGQHTRWVIENEKGQGVIVGRLLMGDGQFFDNRISGTVEVIDGERERTRAGMMFSAFPYCEIPTAGKIPIVQIWNPPNSGKNLNVGFVNFSTSAAAYMTVMGTNLILPNLSSPGQGGNKLVGGPAPAAQLRWAVVDDPALGNRGFLWGGRVQESSVNSWTPRGTVVVPPGFGLGVYVGSLGAALYSTFEWFEEPV